MTPNIQPNPGLPYPPPVEQRGWFARNWMWFLPTGCLTLAVVVVVFIAVLMMIVYGFIKSSDVYKTATHRAETDPRVIAALGSPVTEGTFTTGNVNVENDSGQARLSIPLSGAKEKGHLYVVATKTEGNWTFSSLNVKVDRTNETIDLLEQPSAAP